MDGIKYLKQPKIYIALGVAIVVSLLFIPKEGRFKYNYQKGKPWIYETLIAPIDFPILKTESELLHEKEVKSSQVIRYYDYDMDISLSQLGNVAKAFSRSNVEPALIQDMIESMNEIYDKGIISEYDDDAKSDVIIIQKNRRASEVPLKEVYDVKYAELYLMYKLMNDYPTYNIDSILTAVNISSFFVPNLIYDENKTDLIHKEAVNYISTTKDMVYTGQLIVSEGEIVTSEIAQMLDSYKAEYEDSFGYSGSYIGVIAGYVLLVFMVYAILFATIYFVDFKMFSLFRKYLFFLLLLVLVFISTVLINNFDQSLLYLFPYTVIALYLASFFKNSLAFPVYVVILLPLLILAQEGLEIYFMNVIAGAVALSSFRYLNRGWHQFVNSLFVFFALLLSYTSFLFLSEGSIDAFDMRILIYIALNSFLVIALYPIVYLLEKIFSFVSVSRLRELADTNNKLLLELARIAPGSFQHSLQVANLSEAAARELGANVMLARVGALYHDVGKMRNPQCFVENQPTGMNYHQGLLPIESAKQIISHVDDGIELAKKNRLPAEVIDFIKTHHAHSQTGYFYNVYCNEGGDPDNKAPFTYHGDLPTTKEHVIVMMADAVEAASRTLKSYNHESISSLINSITSKRLSDEQLENADISLREITIVKEVFTKHLLQIYHARITYPERKQ